MYSEWEFKVVYNKIQPYVSFSCIKKKKKRFLLGLKKIMHFVVLGSK